MVEGREMGKRSRAGDKRRLQRRPTSSPSCACARARVPVAALGFNLAATLVFAAAAASDFIDGQLARRPYGIEVGRSSIRRWIASS